MVIDPVGATTDVHLVASGEPCAWRDRARATPAAVEAHRRRRSRHVVRLSGV